MPRIKDQAICLRLIDWSETSQIVELFTREHGKVRGMAKGSKRFSPSSIARFSGGIELMTGGQLLATHKTSSDLLNITEWDLQQPWWHMRQNLRVYELGMYAIDLTAALLAEHDPHPKSFDALEYFFQQASTTQRLEPLLLILQWKLLADVGYQPQLEHDVHTGEALVDGATYQFDPLAGGLCNQSNTSTWGVRKQTVLLLRQLADGESIAQSITSEGVDRGNKLLCSYIRSILDKQLATMTYILG
ncbi:MAG: DNA repair protein RecO [Phycisphaeraceae bacterium]|nr:DNA repair protein RecO [Phycisphaeraceae bacterium]